MARAFELPFYLNFVLLAVLASSICAVSVENDCLCEFNGGNCTPIVEDSTIFYVTACDNPTIYFDKPAIFAPEKIITAGIIKCWDPNFKPKYVTIKNCYRGENILEYVAPKWNYQTTRRPHLKDIFTQRYCESQVVIGLMTNASKINWQGLSVGLMNLIDKILRFPKNYTRLWLENVTVDDKVIFNITSFWHMSLSNVQLTQQIPHGLLKDVRVQRSAIYSNNSLKEVRAQFFTNQTELRTLNLGHNLIDSLGICTLYETDNFLLNLKNLEILDVSHNRISKICPNFFSYSPVLHNINLNYNYITSLDGVFTTDKNRIYFLYLSHNKLEYISDKDLLFLKFLSMLDLSSNHIKFIDKFAFRSLRFFDEINLDNNFLTTLDCDLTSDVIRVNVSVRNNYLQTAPALKDLGLRDANLDLTGNHISYIPIDEWQIEHMQIRQQYGEILDPTDLDSSDTGPPWRTYIILSNNPLTCDCSAIPLGKFTSKWAREYIELEIDSLYCHQPKSLRGILFSSVNEEFLHCLKINHCPRNCTCQVQEGETIVECDHKNLTTIPVTVRLNATTLSMNFNSVSSLKNLHTWNSLRLLSLQHCFNEKTFTDLDMIELNQLQNLTEFFINSNHLARLSDQMFKNNVKLRKINACCNKLTWIKTNLSHLDELIYVDFSDNKLPSVDIEWPKNVKEILLHGNRIRFLNFDKFPQNLHLLDLTRNQFVFLNMAEFDHFLNAGIVFDLSDNLITKISEFKIKSSKDSRFYHENVIVLNRNPINCDCRIKSFLEYLQMENTLNNEYGFKIDNLYCKLPESVKDQLVESLDMSKLPCLQDQCAEDCKCYKQYAYEYWIMECDQFPSDNFVGNVDELYVRNGSTADISQLVGSKWNSLGKVTVRNVIEPMLTAAIFSKMNSLKQLAISNNEHLQFSRKVFSNLSALTHLDLHSNEILDLPSSAFQGDCNLRYLNLSNNLLPTLPQDIFVDLLNLQTLDLSHNTLVKLDDNLFQNLINLEVLSLKRNSLQYLDKCILMNCTSLQELDLSENLISSDSLQNFVIPYQITKIDFSKNDIADIENDWTKLRHLKTFDLSGNSISTVNMSQLSRFPPGIEFKLQSNKVSRVIWFNDLQATKSSFIIVNLERNPFVCDCNLKHFVQFLKQKKWWYLNFGNKLHLKCDQPSELTGTPIARVKQESLYCLLENCPKGCFCKHYSKGEINVVDCNVTPESNLQICPKIVHELYMRGNSSIEFLQNDYLKLLKKLYISHNPILAQTSNELLQNQRRLVELSLSANGMSNVPSKLFQFTPSILVIDLSRNLLQNLSPSLFEKLVDLIVLDLSFNQLTFVDWQIPLGLQSLNLADNRIEDIVIPKLNDHYRLKFLNFSNNSLNELPNKPDFFYHLKNLQLLDLSHNHLRINCNTSFAPFPTSLQSLNLSHNLLHCTHFWNESGKPSARLKNLGLSYNPIATLQINDFLFSNNSELMLDMRNCNLTNYSLNVTHAKNEMWNLLLNIDVTNNKYVECDCNITQYNDLSVIQNKSLTLSLQLVTNTHCDLYHFDITFSKLSKFHSIPKFTFCSVVEHCPFACICLKSGVAIRMFCVKKDYTLLPSMCPYNVQYLNLDYNNLTILSALTHPCWNHLVTISLRHNAIVTISNENLSSLESLQNVFLDGNQLYRPSGWLERFVTDNILPFNITLSNNLWSCTCDNDLFKKWVIYFSTKQKVLDADDMLCSDGNLFINFHLCPVEILKILLPVLAASFVIISVLILTIFYYRKKVLIHAWCYDKNLCGCCVNEVEIDKDKEFDAFLSYCEEDGQYILRELLPGLEKREPFFKVCLHHRDWVLGVPIVEQIESSIKNSRRTIIVLSQNFVKSVWANLEFRIANQQSIEDKINRVIAIALDEKFLTDELDPEFKAHLSMITYLKADDPRFWTKLRYAMPHKKQWRNVLPKAESNLEIMEMDDAV